MKSPRGTDEGEVGSYREQYYTDLKEKGVQGDPKEDYRNCNGTRTGVQILTVHKTNI
jgi:hypothetical protein